MRAITGACAIGTAMLMAVPAIGQAREAEPVDVAEWWTARDYPAEAIRRREQGRVVVLVSIDATGKATACRTDVSMGMAALERAACDIVLARGRFSPATTAKGKAIASELRLPVRWVLPEDDGRQPIGPLDMILTAAIGADDRASSCEMTVDGKVQPPAPGQCAGQEANVAQVRADTGVKGAFRVRMEYAIRHGDTPPPAPGAGVAGRTLLLIEQRLTADAEGQPSACVTTISGEQAEKVKKQPPPDPCAGAVPFRPAEVNGKPVAQQVLISTRYMLLPAAN